MSFLFLRLRALASALAFIGTSIALVTSASAIERTYKVDEDLSVIAVSGTIGGQPIQSQGTGSLTTDYTGTIKADRGANSIQFISGSSVVANDSGIWQPLADGAEGSASANYGGFVNLVIASANFAGRQFEFGLTSSSFTIDGGGDFSFSGLSLAFLNDSSIAYRSSGIGATDGSVDLAGPPINAVLSLSGVGSVTTLGLKETLTIPISGTLELDLEGIPAVVNFNGSLVATAMVPEPTSLATGMIGVASVAVLAWRGRSRRGK